MEVKKSNNFDVKKHQEMIGITNDNFEDLETLVHANDADIEQLFGKKIDDFN